MTHGHQTLSAKPDRVACHRFMASVGPSTGAFAPKLVKRPWATLCMPVRASSVSGGCPASGTGARADMPGDPRGVCAGEPLAVRGPRSIGTIPRVAPRHSAAASPGARPLAGWRKVETPMGDEAPNRGACALLALRLRPGRTSRPLAQPPRHRHAWPIRVQSLVYLREQIAARAPCRVGGHATGPLERDRNSRANYADPC